MIIQNGQNRNLAICNARQVAMLRGGQWITKGNMVLSSEVKSQIYEDIVTTGHHSASLAAEVWRAANLYCKQHAASHPELTSQGKLLSAFVNADKDMYCSLPLALTPEAQSALPTRWLKGDGSAYINTNFIPTGNDLEFYVKHQLLERGQIAKGVFGKGNYNSSVANKIYVTSWHNNSFQNLIMHGGIGWDGDWCGDTSGTHFDYLWEHKITYKDGKRKLYISQDGVEYKNNETDQVVNFANDGVPIYLFKTSTYQPAKTKIPRAYVKIGGAYGIDFLPCLNTETNKYGMLDIVNLQWYGNAAATGSFTIENS